MSRLKRYEVDKVINGSKSIVTLYENSIDQKFQKLEEKENDQRKEERREEENLRDKKIKEFVLQKNHIIKTKTQLMHVITGITVGKVFLSIC